MLSAEALPWLNDAGASAAAILAVLALFALLFKTRPARWLWRTLIGDPATHWLTRTIRAEIDPVKATLDDVAAKNEATSIALGEHMTDEVALREADIKDSAAWRDEVRGELVAIKGEMRRDHAELGGRVDVVHARLDETLVALAAGNPELRPGAMDPEPPGV